MTGLQVLAPVTIAGAFAFGMILALLGSIKLPLAKRLGMDETRVGGLLAAMNLALIPMMLISGILVDQLGIRWMLVGGSVVSGVALAGLALSRTYAATVYAILAMGAGGACLSTGSIVLMPKAFFEDNATASENLGNVFFGLGALVTPALADLLIRGIGFRRTLGLLAVICLVPAGAAVLTPGDEFNPQKHVGDFLGDLGAVFADHRLWLIGLVFMLYGPLEGSLGTWATTYLTELGHREQRAALLLSGFWLTFLGSRLVAAFWQHQRGTIAPAGDAVVIIILALISAVVLGNLAGTHSKGTAGFGLLMVGACFGPIFPALVGIIFNVFPKQVHGTAFGAMFAIGATGSLIVPPIIGAYARRHSVRTALRIPTVVAILLAGAGIMLALVLKSPQ